MNDVIEMQMVKEDCELFLTEEGFEAFHSELVKKMAQAERDTYNRVVGIYNDIVTSPERFFSGEDAFEESYNDRIEAAVQAEFPEKDSHFVSDLTRSLTRKEKPVHTDYQTTLSGDIEFHGDHGVVKFEQESFSVHWHAEGRMCDLNAFDGDKLREAFIATAQEVEWPANKAFGGRLDSYVDGDHRCHFFAHPGILNMINKAQERFESLTEFAGYGRMARAAA